MNTKSKKFTWSGLAYALVLILLATTMVGIVAYAAGSKTHNIGGNVNFTADGIEATISSATWSGGSINTFASADDDTSDTVMQEIVFSTTQSKDTYNKNYLTWDKLSVVVDTPTDSSTTTTATISFTITNNSSSNKLDIAIAPTFTNTDGNASMSVTIDDEETTSTTIGTSSFATINIIFTIKDTSYNAEITDFSIDITLQNYVVPLEVQGNSTDGYYIEMGEYPTTFAGYASSTSYTETDEKFTLADGTAYTVYIDSSDNRYIQYTANSYSTSYYYSDYTSTADKVATYFKLEPIKWEVIGFYDTNDLDSDSDTTEVIYNFSGLDLTTDLTDEQIIVISELGLEAMAWYATSYTDSEIDYINSDVYTYLNNFYTNVLATDYSSYITTRSYTYNDTSETSWDDDYADSSGGIPDGELSTSSKMWLLSWTEADTWFDSTEDDCSDYASPSDFALATGAYMYTNTSYTTDYRTSGGTCCWWLRSSGGVYAGYVGGGGFIDYGNVSSADDCVRPALLINL